MYYDDHAPPHFHAVYAGQEVSLALADLRILQGRLPRRALGLLRAWGRLHRDELDKNWANARQGHPLDKIPGLE